MSVEESLKLSDKEIAAMFASPAWAERYPPILTVEQASELLQIPVETLRDWRSRGLLGFCCRRVGKRLRFVRSRLIQLAFNEGLLRDSK
jgi:hypothetical protein